MAEFMVQAVRYERNQSWIDQCVPIILAQEWDQIENASWDQATFSILNI